MTVGINHASHIAMLSDWLKNLVSVFQQIRSKTKTKLHFVCMISSCALSRLQGMARNSDSFIALFIRVVISWRNYFGIDSLEII